MDLVSSYSSLNSCGCIIMLHPVAPVPNIEVSIDSVEVSWDIIDTPEIIGYIVYYSQTGSRERQSKESITVPSSNNSVVIEGLLNNVEYQFQVVAIVELDGDVTTGQPTLLSTKAKIVVSNTSGILPSTMATAETTTATGAATGGS